MEECIENFENDNYDDNSGLTNDEDKSNLDTGIFQMEL